MKRTGEFLFSLIGVILFSLLFVGSLVFYGNMQNSSATEELAQEFLTDENITEVTVGQVVTFLENGVLYFGVISLICAVLGIVSIVLLKRDIKSNAAGKILITTAILSTILTLIVGIVASWAYLIAGITSTVRTKKIRKAA
ncbi:DUF4064 domain-containing protein [Oceanobacillus chungangensis]|uniref:DUF4064 domain-containing protein n=1 Tax=Oceanobacillus chungangensis TaxID=1229152 RepID=A0A3D8PLQ1_9BACI|nr:DUF4064 domain-containing protein [Oceanobacillus chungangensis]RDW16168.1 hypothetical protein CWR45_14920 [Oceanobacillus chungangensis]